MMNHHFFDAAEKTAVVRMAKHADAFILDPPFGADLAALADSLRQLADTLGRALESFTIFLFFPYFNEVSRVRGDKYGNLPPTSALDPTTTHFLVGAS